MRSLFIALGLLVATLTTPAAAQSPVPDPTGDWRGTLAGAATLRVALHIGPVSTFDSPDQGVLGLPAEVTIENERVTATITGVGVFEGELSTDGQSLDGVLKQGPASLPLHFERGVFSAANRPQTPRPPYPYNVEEVAYDTLLAESVTINRSAQELYQFWRDPANLVEVMENIVSIETVNDELSRWTVRAPAGSEMRWDSVITKDVPGREIHWQSAKGADVANSGRIEFNDAGQRGTVVRAVIAYDPPAGAVGQLIAKLFQREPRIQTRRDLHRFKQLMETGEIATGARNRRILNEQRGEEK